MIFNDTIQAANTLGRKLLIEFSKELTNQGHNGTGKLISSLEKKVVATKNTVELEILFEEYGMFLDTGRRPNANKVPVGAIIDWLMQKGLGSLDEDIRSIAFAIQQTIFKEGSPTKYAKRKGKRTGWFTDTLDKEERNIISFLTTSVGNDIEISVNNEITKHNQLVKPIEVVM